MKEIRVTFKGEDFAAVSERLIDLGIVFQVEPLKDDGEAVVPVGRANSQTVPRERQPRQTVKSTGKAGAAERSGGIKSNASAAAEAAARLRAMAERNRAATGRAGPESPERQAGEERSEETNTMSPPPPDPKS